MSWTSVSPTDWQAVHPDKHGQLKSLDIVSIAHPVMPCHTLSSVSAGAARDLLPEAARYAQDCERDSGTY